MKKVVLVMVCSLIMTVFIAFNYLLWDREKNIMNLENLNDSKNASLEALSREVDANKQLRNRLLELEDANKTLLAKNTQLEQERQRIKASADYKNEIINKLKQRADLKPLEEIIRNWTESIDKGQYQTAYEFMSKAAGGQEPALSLNDFTNNYRNSVKSIRVKALKLNMEGVPEDKKGDIVLRVSLEVKKADNTSSTLYSEGNNDRLFTMVYDRDKDNWFISTVDAVP